MFVVRKSKPIEIPLGMGGGCLCEANIVGHGSHQGLFTGKVEGQSRLAYG